MSFNKIILVGNLGKDPELRYSTQGDPICSFTMATNERRKDKSGEMQDLTTWFRVTLFGRQAETASQYLTKGRSVYIEGRLRQDVWTDRDGKERTTLDVRATDMQFIGSREDAGGGSGGYDAGSERSTTRPEPGASPSAGATTGGDRQPARNNAPPANEPDLDDSDIPF